MSEKNELPKVIHIWKEDMAPPKNPGTPHRVEVLRQDRENHKPDNNWAEYRLAQKAKKK
jgi:hypothetical protein